MYRIASVDSILKKIGLDNGVIESIVDESVFSGLTYIELCRECGEYRVCLLTKVMPVDVDEYSVVASGLTIIVDRDKVFDETIEKIMCRSTVIKYQGNRVFFYIPVEYMLYIYNKICSSIENKRYEIRSISDEDLLNQIGEENDSF
uniref:Uncharacterized protein n=1 Tax=Staphylothermus marinus TaxID=2280 RepID=A0A7C4D9G3_STAMA